MRRNVNRPTFLAMMAAATVGIGMLIYGAGLVGASESNSQEEPQAMPVQAMVVTPESIQLWKQFSGHVVAVDRAEIRPQVDGRITEILFDDGQHVEKDDVLMIIDPRPYQAALGQARAALAAAQTQAALAEKEYQRAKKLLDTNDISHSLMDSRENARKTANAAVNGAKALVSSAEVDLDYAFVKAPIAGKVSRAEITVGNVVQAGANAPLLTSIVADEKVYVDFEVDERTYLQSVRGGKSQESPAIPVRLSLLDGELEYNGEVESFDNRIDPASGTIRARAVFDNAEKMLLPGMSVSVQMGSANDQKQILVSERAIGTDQDRKFVYVVDGEGKTAYREVSIGSSIDGRRVVLSGLNAGDTVVTEGMVRIRPGMAVTPQFGEKPAEISALTSEESAIRKD